MTDNTIDSKLYQDGPVHYVPKSDGMSNELNNILSLFTAYNRAIDAVEKGVMMKLIVAWAIGTCLKIFTTGIVANRDLETQTADARTAAMREAGVVVPDTFEELPRVPKPMNASQGSIYYFNGLQELDLIRKPAAFISTISDEHGQELFYADMSISDVFKEDIGAGSVVSSLWFNCVLWCPCWLLLHLQRHRPGQRAFLINLEVGGVTKYLPPLHTLLRSVTGH
ncbi:hypothetical protein JOM56_013299 [Amanita muscaria]